MGNPAYTGLGDPQRHGLMPYHNNLPMNPDVT